MELKINKKYIHSVEDFKKVMLEENKDIDLNKEDEKIIYENVILIKNYLLSKDINDILNLGLFKYSLPKLIKMNLTANNIETIPDIFKSLKELKILILNNNKIEKITNLENLTKLEILELRGNKINKVEGLNNLTNLTKLTLSCNLITNIEENDFPKIDSLLEFGIFGNYLGIENREFDEKINDENIKKLTNFIQMINIKFNNLKSLYIGGNFFTNLNELKDNNNTNRNYKDIIKSIIPNIIIDGQN